MASSISGTILVVDDDEVDREMISRIIRDCRPDIKLVQAFDGAEALRMISIERPDLVIMDIEMPGLNGRETLQRLKSDPALSFIPIIMMSTSTRDEDVQYCYRHHANAFLAKTVGKQSSDLENLLAFWFGSVIRCQSDKPAKTNSGPDANSGLDRL